MNQFHRWVVGVWYVRIKSLAGEFWTGQWIGIINNAGCKEFSAVLGSDKIVKLTWFQQTLENHLILSDYGSWLGKSPKILSWFFVVIIGADIIEYNWKVDFTK